ncbi:hypothetical protein jhhlp_000160 [Lomentospora prolificans]|uniref:Uncharacterized protein n=1 Tax=Lomentospora prolificans TaxID=41688 RepID=A0A2N3NLU6_9PEZI|nr:hypothetical protein jhhlp_000160 [Lomentospora prolificans]
MTEQTTCPNLRLPPFNPSGPNQQEISAILARINHDRELMGVISLGKDGVFQSQTADGSVVDAMGTFLSCMPDSWLKQNAYDGAEGSKVPKGALFNPNKSLLSAPLSQEAREKSQELGRKRQTQPAARRER